MIYKQIKINWDRKVYLAHNPYFPHLTLVDPPWSPLARWVTLLISKPGKTKQSKTKQGKSQIVEILTVVLSFSNLWHGLVCGSTLDSSGLVTYPLLYHNIDLLVLRFIFHYLIYFSFLCLPNLHMSCRIYNQQSVLICLWNEYELLQLFVSVKLSHKPCRGNPNWNIQINFRFKHNRN